MNISPKEIDWFKIAETANVASPALLIYPDRVAENIRRMLAIVGGDASRLRPHVKTHKLRPVVEMQVAAGLRQFKCATIAEAEMTAACGDVDVLLAYQPVGPNVRRFAELVHKFSKARFSTIVDSADVLSPLSEALARNGGEAGVLVDVDCGFGRCGIPAGDEAFRLYQAIGQYENMLPGGLHAYDGHVRALDPDTRRRECDSALAAALELRARIERARGEPCPLVAGGTPTFAIHAAHRDRQCSPGTCLLWDAGYATKIPDLDFLVAAVLLTRVISKPSAGTLTLDLGYKAVSPDNADPRVVFPELPDAQAVVHSEEHLTIRTARAGEFRLGDVLYGIPWHICPTVALHSEAVIVRDGAVTDRWPITARDRAISV